MPKLSKPELLYSPEDMAAIRTIAGAILGANPLPYDHTVVKSRVRQAYLTAETCIETDRELRSKLIE